MERTTIPEQITARAGDVTDFAVVDGSECHNPAGSITS